MPDFRFDDSKSFAENCEAFLEAIKADDPKMAAILRDNWDALVTVVQEGKRDSKARSEFNASVVATLDALAKSAGPKDGA